MNAVDPFHFKDPACDIIIAELTKIRKNDPILDKHLGSWQSLCAEFKRRAPYVQPLHERIMTWNPETPEGKEFKHSWKQMFQNLSKPENKHYFSLIMMDVLVMAEFIENRSLCLTMSSLPEES